MSSSQPKPTTHPIATAVYVEYFFRNGYLVYKAFHRKADPKSFERLSGLTYDRHLARMMWLDEKHPLPELSRVDMDVISTPDCWAKFLNGSRSLASLTTTTQVRYE